MPNAPQRVKADGPKAEQGPDSAVTALEPSNTQRPPTVSKTHDREVGKERRAFDRVAGIAAGMMALIGLTYLVPALHSFRPWVPGGAYVPFWNVVGREWLGQGKKLEEESAALAELERETQAPVSPASMPVRRAKTQPAALSVFPAYEPQLKVDAVEHGIEPPEALDDYFRKLTLVDLGVKGAVARAGHWGDSVLGVDGITSGIRRRLQSRFGDAGHGFHLMDRYNPSYQHQGVRFEPGGGWSRCLIVQECSKHDRRYGYGGLIVHSGGGAAASWATTKKGVGQVVSRFELWFAYQEHGGKLEIGVDGKPNEVVDTRGPHLKDGWHRVRVAPGAHRFVVRAAGGGDVRAYGVVLENDGPGVVWDGMAIIGGSTRGLRTQDPEHSASQIRHRDLDLLVFMFGGNDMERNYVDLKESMQPYYEEYGEVVKHFRAGKPEAACLIMSLTDHGKRMADESIVSRRFAKQLSLAQREVARQNGCGFFDTYEAMGGTGTAARWYRARPRLISPDLGHPNSLGHEIIAGLLTNAILSGYEEYRARMQGKALPELAASRPTHGDVEDGGATLAGSAK